MKDVGCWWGGGVCASKTPNSVPSAAAAHPFVTASPTMSTAPRTALAPTLSVTTVSESTWKFRILNTTASSGRSSTGSAAEGPGRALQTWGNAADASAAPVAGENVDSGADGWAAALGTRTCNEDRRTGPGGSGGGADGATTAPVRVSVGISAGPSASDPSLSSVSDESERSAPALEVGRALFSAAERGPPELAGGAPAAAVHAASGGTATCPPLLQLRLDVALLVSDSEPGGPEAALLGPCCVPSRARSSASTRFMPLASPSARSCASRRPPDAGESAAVQSPVPCSAALWADPRRASAALWADPRRASAAAPGLRHGFRCEQGTGVTRWTPGSPS